MTRVLAVLAATVLLLAGCGTSDPSAQKSGEKPTACGEPGTGLG